MSKFKKTPIRREIEHNEIRKDNQILIAKVKYIESNKDS
jgi:hypothetical protein